MPRKVMRSGRPRLLRPLRQTGMRKSVKLDRKRKALPSGKRVSKTGKVYWETRRNRSDKRGSKL